VAQRMMQLAKGIIIIRYVECPSRSLLNCSIPLLGIDSQWSSLVSAKSHRDSVQQYRCSTPKDRELALVPKLARRSMGGKFHVGVALRGEPQTT